MLSINRIKPKYLELVVKIAETSQLQLASQALNISQPAASRILNELETQIDVSLFNRHPTGMEPTPAGHIFIRHARSALTELTTMSEELDHFKSGLMGTVRIGAVTGPAVGHLMPAVQSVLETAPELRISVDVAPSVALFRGLEEARYDFVLGRSDPYRDTKDYRFHPARKENVRLLVHDTHPLAEREKVDLSELTTFPWVIQEEGSPIRVSVENAFYAQGIPVPTRVINSSSLLVALAQIENSQTIAPQTEEVARMLMSKQMGTRLKALNVASQMEVPPYFVIQDARRKLTRAADVLLNEVLARF